MMGLVSMRFYLQGGAVSQALAAAPNRRNFKKVTELLKKPLTWRPHAPIYLLPLANKLVIITP